jgi:hypothetical protein
LPARGTHTYRVTVSGNVTLIAYTEGGVDTYIRLLNASGTQLASDDDSGSSLNARISVNVTDGTYTIQVSGYEDSSGSYTIHVSTSASSGAQASNPYANTRWVFQTDSNYTMTISLTNDRYAFVIVSDGRTIMSSGTYTYSGDSIRFLPSNSSATANPTAIVVDNIRFFEVDGTTATFTKHVSTSGGSQASNPYANTRWAFQQDSNHSITLSLTADRYALVVVSNERTATSSGTYTYSGDSIRFLPSDSRVPNPTAIVVDNTMVLEINGSMAPLTKQ